MTPAESSLDLLVRCERAEAEGFASLMTCIEERVKIELGIRSARIAVAPVWSCSAIEWGLFNRTIGLGLYRPCTPDALNEIGTFFGGRAHAIEASPSATGLHPTSLADLGYSLARSRPKFVRSSEPHELPAGVTVLGAEPGDASAYADVMAASFGFPEVAKAWMRSVIRTPHPGRICAIAFVDGKPAGTGFLCVSDGIGWLGGGCCLPEFRGMGVQRALIEGRSAMARDLGAHWLTSETNPDTSDEPGYSFRNMLRSGFVHAFDRPQFVKGAG